MCSQNPTTNHANRGFNGTPRPAPRTQFRQTCGGQIFLKLREFVEYSWHTKTRGWHNCHRCYFNSTYPPTSIVESSTVYNRVGGHVTAVTEVREEEGSGEWRGTAGNGGEGGRWKGDGSAWTSESNPSVARWTLVDPACKNYKNIHLSLPEIYISLIGCDHRLWSSRLRSSVIRPHSFDPLSFGPFIDLDLPPRDRPSVHRTLCMLSHAFRPPVRSAL